MNSSEDETDSDSDSKRRRGTSEAEQTGSGRNQAVAGHGDGDIAGCVQELCGRGFMEELQWLEAYLADEARDRTLDGE